MTGIDPDDAFSAVPYEKGHTLLYYLETLVGGVGTYSVYNTQHYLISMGKVTKQINLKTFITYFYG